MARTKDDNKRQAIREATILQVVEGGLASASVARIAARAGLSQGTLYVYHRDKDTLLRDIYIDIKRELHTRLIGARDPAATSATNLKRIWFALLDHAIEQPHLFAFTESVVAARLFDERAMPELDAIRAELRAVVTTAIADGTLKSAPYDALVAVLVAPVIQLSRRVALGGHAPDRALSETTFDLVWDGVAASTRRAARTATP